ncbi:MAG: hypothetical protein ABW139_04690 [Candidatus Thiodiazotropha sp. DIVDIV]
MSGRFYRDLNVAHIAQWIAEQGRVLEPQRDEAETFLKHLDKVGAVFLFVPSPIRLTPGKVLMIQLKRRCMVQFQTAGMNLFGSTKKVP